MFTSWARIKANCLSFAAGRAARPRPTETRQLRSNKRGEQRLQSPQADQGSLGVIDCLLRPETQPVGTPQRVVERQVKEALMSLSFQPAQREQRVQLFMQTPAAMLCGRTRAERRCHVSKDLPRFILYPAGPRRLG